jgi:hypothetical protein
MALLESIDESSIVEELEAYIEIIFQLTEQVVANKYVSHAFESEIGVLNS